MKKSPDVEEYFEGVETLQDVLKLNLHVNDLRNARKNIGKG